MARLTTDKSAYAIGDFVTYSITGAKPNADIAWTSFRNGQPTGEFQAQYGQHTDANGNWTGQAVQPWTTADQGAWQKQVLLISSGPTYDQAEVNFTVGNVSSVAPHAQTGGFLSGSTNVPIFGQVPNVALIGVVIIGALLLSGGGGRGR